MSAEIIRLQKELEDVFVLINKVGLQPEWALCIDALALQEIPLKRNL